MSIQLSCAVNIRVEKETIELHKIVGSKVEKQNWSLMSWQIVEKGE